MAARKVLSNMVKWIWADLETLIDSYSDLGISVISATLDYGDLTHGETKPISDSVGAPGFIEYDER